VWYISVKSSVISIGYKLPTIQESSLFPSSGSLVTKIISETSLISKQLTRLMARLDFIDFSHLASFRTFGISGFLDSIYRPVFKKNTRRFVNYLFPPSEKKEEEHLLIWIF
jgi:hypothetical protein